MRIANSLHIGALFIVISVGVATADDVTLESASPVVVKTIPESGSNGVDPKLTEIKVTYSC
jgi:hypothetical protein